MKNAPLARSVLACLALGLAGTPLHAQAPVKPTPAPPAANATNTCLNDLRAFNTSMEKEGYWLGSSGYGYGFPMDGYGYGYGPDSPGGYQMDRAGGYRHARPGYEIRVLMSAATILAQNNNTQACADVLTTTQAIYKSYTEALRASGMRAPEGPGWAQRQISAAVPVTSQKTAFRSDQLLDVDVRNAGNETLASVHDLVMNPQTGKIAYLILARGGIFGIGESFVPVPWADFKAAPNVGLLVLDTTRPVLAAAPTVHADAFAAPGQFDQESLKIDAYWNLHLAAGSGG
jgi:sporulation protein YlmC with PRC-barrel domain